MNLENAENLNENAENDTEQVVDDAENGQVDDVEDAETAEADPLSDMFKARLKQLSAKGKNAAKTAGKHLAAKGKSAVHATGKNFKDVVDNGIVGPTVKKVNSNHNMPAWGEDFIEKMLTGEEKGDDMGYE